MNRVTRTGAGLRSTPRARLLVRPFHHTGAVSSLQAKSVPSQEGGVNQDQTAVHQNPGQGISSAAGKKAESSSAAKKKTVAEMDEELRLKLEGRSGGGGLAGIEYEGGKAEGLKRGVKSNMFRVI
ncbi:hypothetical protein F5883DRAFT_135690 [Diaporthe sp. PMI_573]|nr:hypothetical protein F5883DRAFT_135690 [Diaporthaceae sp. PMI_573]